MFSVVSIVIHKLVVVKGASILNYSVPEADAGVGVWHVRIVLSDCDI